MDGAVDIAGVCYRGDFLDYRRPSGGWRPIGLSQVSWIWLSAVWRDGFIFYLANFEQWATWTCFAAGWFYFPPNIVPSAELKMPERNVALYSIGEVSVGTFIGGPAAGCYFLSQNYKQCGDLASARKIFWQGIAGSLILFGGLVVLPEKIGGQIPNSIIPAVYTGIIASVAEIKQGAILRQYFKSGGKKRSYWKVFGWSFLFLALIFVVLIVAAMMLGLE